MLLPSEQNQTPIEKCRVKPTLQTPGAIVGGSRSHSDQDLLDPLIQLSRQFPGDLDCSTWERDLRGA